jgi:hypothetical protein
VTLVEMHFADGRVVAQRPVGDVFLFAIPRAYIKRKRQLAFAVGYTASHVAKQRSGVVFRLP